jgi:hypothetical protein
MNADPRRKIQMPPKKTKTKKEVTAIASPKGAAISFLFEIASSLRSSQ